MPRTTRARSRGDSVTSASGEVSETAHAAIRAKKAKKSSRKETVREDDRQDETVTAQAADQALVLHEESTPRVLNLAPGRVSELLGPNVQLKGHGGAIYSCAFDPSGALLASGSMDKNILLWDVFSKDGCTNYNVLTGHKGAILEVKWLPSSASSPCRRCRK